MGLLAIVREDPNFHGGGNCDTGDTFPAAPDLVHADKHVRAELTAWLRWLQNEIGFKGWRFDYARGYGAGHVAEYITSTTGAEHCASRACSGPKPRSP